MWERVVGAGLEQLQLLSSQMNDEHLIQIQLVRIRIITRSIHLQYILIATFPA